MKATRKGTVPEDFPALQATIAQHYPQLSRQLQKIGRFALEYPEEFALQTIATLAQRTEVQPSSMVRFAQALGYDGFSGMQQVFRTHLVNRSDSYRERIERLRRKPRERAGDVSMVLADFVEEGIASLQLLGESAAPADLDRAVRLLAQAQDIYVLAERRAFPVAFYLAYALNRLERRAHLLDGVGGTLQQQASLVRPQDVLVAISFPPYSPAVADIFAERHEHGVPTIAITDSPVSPLALEAKVFFGIKQQEERPFRSLAAPMCIAQTLVVGLGHHLASRRNAAKR